MMSLTTPVSIISAHNEKCLKLPSESDFFLKILVLVDFAEETL